MNIPQDPFELHQLQQFMEERAKDRDPMAGHAKQYNADAAKDEVEKAKQTAKKVREPVATVSPESTHLPTTNPAHYRDLVPSIKPGVQYFQLVEDLIKHLSPGEALIMGTIYGYMFRFGHKDHKEREAEKMAWYAMYLVSYLKAGGKAPEVLDFDVHARKANVRPERITRSDPELLLTELRSIHKLCEIAQLKGMRITTEVEALIGKIEAGEL